jgi:CheY-like chemotaxis protein
MSISDVLVVDDEDVVLSAVSRILSAHSVNHRVARSAEEALVLTSDTSPEILLADIKLPGKSGLELVKICTERFPSIVAVCMTGYANAEHVLLSLESGAVDFLPKPFTVEEVMSTLTRASNVVRLGTHPKLPEGYFFLNGHTWARTEEDGTVTLGLTELFLWTVGSVESVEVPAPNTMLRQGGVLTRVTAKNGQVHRAWCAVGGRVEHSNLTLEVDSDLVSREPYEAGWIATVMPTSIEEEVARLGLTLPRHMRRGGRPGD